MGSTFPLLEIEAVKSSRATLTTGTAGACPRLASTMRTSNASPAASPRTIHFLLLFSAMMGCARSHSLPHYLKIVTDPFGACLCKTPRRSPEAHISGMLYSPAKMAIVFVIARDWTLRTPVRAELRELGIDALGMESPEDVGRA